VTRQGLTEEFYLHIGDERHNGEYSTRELLAAEYAERFVVDHLHIDDDLFDRLRDEYSDEEVLDLTFCIATFMGLGRLLRVLGIDETCQTDVPSSPAGSERPS
jgi:alkylhydroperoxidase family enzyme